MPIQVAVSIFSSMVSISSSALATTSDRLQNSSDLSWISPHGFVPEILRLSRLLGAIVLADSKLKMPLSPEPDAIRALHSFIKVTISGLELYTAELLAI